MLSAEETCDDNMEFLWLLFFCVQHANPSFLVDWDYSIVEILGQVSANPQAHCVWRWMGIILAFVDCFAEEVINTRIGEIFHHHPQNSLIATAEVCSWI